MNIENEREVTEYDVFIRNVNNVSHYRYYNFSF